MADDNGKRLLRAEIERLKAVRARGVDLSTKRFIDKRIAELEQADRVADALEKCDADT